MTVSGGSSSVLRSALNPSVVIMWASSIMYTRYLPERGRRDDSRMSSFISLIPRFDAASISLTSGNVDLSIALQWTQVLHGSIESPLPVYALLRQLIDLANIRAVDVFPVPLFPINKKA